jgi:hypothetical protein
MNDGIQKGVNHQRVEVYVRKNGYMKAASNLTRRVFILLLMLSGCKTVALQDGTKPFSNDFLYGLKAKTRYQFELTSGQKIDVVIEGVKDDTVRGYTLDKNELGTKIKTPYQASFAEMENYVTAVSDYKLDPGGVGIGLAIIGTIFMLVMLRTDVTLP